jgi:hypothetical protein
MNEETEAHVPVQEQPAPPLGPLEGPPETPEPNPPGHSPESTGPHPPGGFTLDPGPARYGRYPLPFNQYGLGVSPRPGQEDPLSASDDERASPTREGYGTGRGPVGEGTTPDTSLPASSINMPRPLHGASRRCWR